MYSNIRRIDLKRKLLIVGAILAIVIIAAAALTIFYIKSENENNVTTVGQWEIDYINSPRYADSLVLYTEEADRNEFGYEILVEKRSGFVIDCDLMVSITEDTFVLSGHGEAASLLNQVEVGDIVKIDDIAVTVKRHPAKSGLKKIEIYKNKVDDIVEYRTEKLYDIDKNGVRRAETKISKEIMNLRWYLFLNAKVDEEVVNTKIAEIMKLIDEKYYCTIESRAVEGRGLWHRPGASGIKENDIEGIRAFVARLEEMGINALYVETYWQGMTTYKSDLLGLQHPRMADGDYGQYGNDYMLALISECHKKGIEVHAWVEVLNAGIVGYNPPSYIKDAWLCKNLDGDSSDNYFDPTNPEVRELILGLIGEMLEKYDFDGISYDYIRYAETGDYAGYIDCGFTENSIALFSEKYGYSGDNLPEDLKNDTALRADWHKFKQEAITDLVRAMSAHIRSVDPEAVISASPYGYIDDAKSIYMQDIDTWLTRGYLDVVLPMIYTENTELLSDTADDYDKYSHMVLQYTGISPLYNGATLRQNQELAETARELNISGVSFFASQNYITRSEEYNELISGVLSSSTHSGRAITPTGDADSVFNAWKTQLLDRYQRLYKKEMGAEEIALLEEFDRSTEGTISTAADIAERLELLQAFAESTQHFDNAAVSDRITGEVDYICHILEASLSRSLIRDGLWNPETEPERPDPINVKKQ